MINFNLKIICVGLLVSFTASCKDAMPVDEAKAAGKTAEDFRPTDQNHFADMDMVAGDGGARLKPLELTPEGIKGRNTWMLWTGGNEAFWDWLARNGYGTQDLLRLIDSRQRHDRFNRAGLLTEPGTRPSTLEEAEAEDAFGIWYDRLITSDPSDQPNPEVYGYSSGVIGLRLFRNPEFKGAAKASWDSQRYYKDSEYAARPDTIRPFRVGMSCAFCHASPHPLNPPVDPENPEWANLSSNIGSQYLRVRAVFGNRLEEDNFLYQVLDSQLPGTIDTSLVASDNINNANTMNAVFGIPWRVERATKNPRETLSQASEIYPGLWEERDAEIWNTNPRLVPRVLLDGSDSVGVAVALARVYLNIGTYHQRWIQLQNPLLGFKPQDSFKLKDCEDNSIYWQATKARVEPLIEFFLNSTNPMLLRDAPEGAQLGKLRDDGQSWDAAYAKGRKVFANGCIACHSSIQPGDFTDLEKAINADQLPSVEDRHILQLTSDDLARLTRGDGELPPGYLRWAQAAVEAVDEDGRDLFWKNNYLSIDRRIPVTLTGTNSARAMATNSINGNMWEDFSSLTYRNLDSVGRIRYRDPFSGATRSFQAPSGGPGYYRVPSLISIWATAPYLHNNSLGLFNNDPSVQGRLETFNDAITKFLWPSRRADHSDPVVSQRLREDGGLVWRTSSESSFKIPHYHIPGLLIGFTGWSPFLIALVPWMPAIAFVILGVALLLSRTIIDQRERFERRFPQLRGPLSHIRILIAFLALGIAVTTGILAYSKWNTLQLFESTSGAITFGLRIQSLFPALFFFALGCLFLLHKFRVKRFRYLLAHSAGVVCLVVAVVTTMSFGRFLSGNGRDIVFGPFPKGMPVNAIANMDPKAPWKDRKKALQALVTFVGNSQTSDPGQRPGLHEFEQSVGPTLMNVSKCPDFVMDRGHDYEFMRHWSDEEKNELIELLKTF